MQADPYCPMCHGDGIYREYRGEYWGMPAYEWAICLCVDGKIEDAEELTNEKEMKF